MSRVIDLDGAPSLPKVFGRAVLTARGRDGAAGLPDLRVARRGVTIDPQQLADYDRVCGYPLRDVVPTTYLHNLVFPLQATLFADRSYPYSMLGSVHLVNRLISHRPVTLGERLDLVTWADNARPHRRGVEVDVISQARVADELVWEGCASYLYRGQRTGGQVPPREQETPSPDGPGSIWRLPADLGRRFAAVSGDANPIHLHPLTARALGFPRTIAHGMWAQAAMLAAIENRLPAAYVATMSFRKPVLVPGTVRFVQQRTGESVELALRRDRDDTLLVRGAVAPIS